MLSREYVCKLRSSGGIEPWFNSKEQVSTTYIGRTRQWRRFGVRIVAVPVNSSDVVCISTVGRVLGDVIRRESVLPERTLAPESLDSFDWPGAVAEPRKAGQQAH